MLNGSFSRSKGLGKALSGICTIALSAVLLSACSGQPAASDSGSGASPASAGQAASVDVSSWKTLGDALAVQTASMSSGWNDNYYVAVFQGGDSYYRVVAKMDAETDDKIDNVDWTRDDADKQIAEAAGGLPLVSAEDVTGELLGQAELDALVGKTGQELIDDGWTFDRYLMYGGDQTAAGFVKGYFCYSFTFDTTVPEGKTEDGGASVMGVSAVSAEFYGAADSATDPEHVG